MRYQLPPLNSLRIFEAASRLISFKNAAHELNLTPSAVSHGIQNLEAWLGLALFNRSSKGLVLTEAGQDYSNIVRDVLDKLSTGSTLISKGSGAKSLSISVAPTFADRWLLPKLQSFRALHPDIVFTLDTAQENTELANFGSDIAIRMGNGNWPHLTADRLFQEQLVPVCSPAIADRIEELDRIDNVPLIHVLSVSEDWAAWSTAAGIATPDRRKGLQFDTIQMAFRAASEGLGVALGRKPLVNSELKSGELVEIWGPPHAASTSYWLLTTPDRLANPIVRFFRTWILQVASKDRPEKSAQ